MYSDWNTKARSRNRCWRGKAISITYICVCACVRACGCGCTGAGVCLRARSLINQALNAPPYCQMRPLWLNHIFRHYLINSTIFGKQLLNIKWVLWFSLRFLFKISHSLKNSARYCHKCENAFMWSTRYSCRILMITEFFQPIFDKKLECKISLKSVQWEPSYSMRTDRRKARRDEANSSFSQFCERA